MDSNFLPSISLRASRRADSNHLQSRGLASGKSYQDSPLKIIWKRGFIRLVLVGGIIWGLLILTALLFHAWSCQSSIAFFSALCNKSSVIYGAIQSLGLVTPPHRCSIPVADDPNKIVIPQKRSPEKFVQSLSYFMEDFTETNGSQSPPLFGGHITWQQRDESFKVKPTMKVHCGFIRNGGAEMAQKDVQFVKKCRFVVASGIFDGYDTPHQPSNISARSQKLFCFLMVKNVTVREDNDGGEWVGIWRLILLKHPPYDEPRRNGKVPKILTHRLFPQAQYSIWIDGKMELIVDPLLLLERYLWSEKNTFAIAQHKHHRNVYEAADANKRRKRYAHIPEGAVIIREHTALSNLFSCLWFNEVHLFTPRDQLSFGYVVYRLGGLFKFFMFPNCEYNSIFILHNHTREHSSKVEWVKSLDEFKKDKTGGLKESRGGLGLWTPYPGDLDSVVLPSVKRTSKAG
ncbi:hypothetical protein R3W88_004122 [Solanum pinnatisectum]|uniref:TOD1/MUCI70 glycosyltransferase-like domain-containing protein n=1 Tax=Solanum pinnatisectum TaxID=50273 RepID=A0AAV9MR25_9SOLN|nr:hypothetical protein R3W88_004122 [Solanum pinnatisectum]